MLSVEVLGGSVIKSPHDLDLWNNCTSHTKSCQNHFSSCPVSFKYTLELKHAGGGMIVYASINFACQKNGTSSSRGSSSSGNRCHAMLLQFRYWFVYKGWAGSGPSRLPDLTHNLSPNALLSFIRFLWLLLT